MNKLASCLVGIGLTTLALSACTAPSATDSEHSSSDTTAIGVGMEQVVPGDPTETALPADSSAMYEEGFWEQNQAPLGTATAAIQEQFPREFAYAFFDDSSAMHVGFSGSAPTEAVALLENTGLPYVIVESLGFNAAEYETATDVVVDQTLRYVTEERQVTVSSVPSAGPGVIVVSFQSDDPELTTNPGLTEAITVEEPFTVTFDDTNTSPTIMGTGTEQVLPPQDE
jgi:hypothetical protein